MTTSASLIIANVFVCGVNPQEERRRGDPATPPVISCDISTRERRMVFTGRARAVFSIVGSGEVINEIILRIAGTCLLRQSVLRVGRRTRPELIISSRPRTGYRCGRFFLKHGMCMRDVTRAERYQ